MAFGTGGVPHFAADGIVAQRGQVSMGTEMIAAVGSCDPSDRSQKQER